MPYNVKRPVSFYDWISNIDSLQFPDKSVLLVGAGFIAEQYAIALRKLKIQDVTVISKSEEKTAQFCSKFGFKPLAGGFEKHLASTGKKDLVVIATQVNLLAPAAQIALESGQSNVLIEKPVSVDSEKIMSLARQAGSRKVRVGYNRLMYSNFHRLKELINEEGGATSCKYTFTEWPHTFDFKKYHPDTFKFAGITDCLHPISMAHELIGMPKQISCHRSGRLDWHPSGSIFVGSGTTESGAQFSYHADWGSAGRWSIEVMTRQNAYRLMPLEDLYVCHKASVNWEKVPFKTAHPDLKQGIAEEIAAMLDESDHDKPDLMNLEKAASYVKLAKEIFGY
jgi:predicted dehydrogenase